MQYAGARCRVCQDPIDEVEAANNNRTHAECEDAEEMD